MNYLQCYHCSCEYTEHAVVDFNIQHTFKTVMLINTGAFKKIYCEFNNRFERRIDVEVKVRACIDDLHILYPRWDHADLITYYVYSF